MRPILLQDPVEVGVRVVCLGRSSFDMDWTYAVLKIPDKMGLR
jgi:hypothetical protein